MEKLNPQNKERHVESSIPGELLCQDVYFVGHFKGVDKVYAHTCVDTYSSLGFAFLHTSKEPKAAAALLHNDVLPFYQQHQVPIQTILTDNGREFCGSENHLETYPCEVYLLLNDTCASQNPREKPTDRVPYGRGFAERFHRTLQEGFSALQLRKILYESVETLQADLDVWLEFYNTERPPLGYRNHERRPIDTFLSTIHNSKLALKNVTIEG